MTPRLESPMSAPATGGVSMRLHAGRSAPAATGMPTRLYPKAHRRLPWILPMVCFERWSASTTWCTLSRRSTTLATSAAAPTPPAMAIPTSACASAAASLTPSPTIATPPPLPLPLSPPLRLRPLFSAASAPASASFCCKLRMNAAFSAGLTPPWMSWAGIPTAAPTARATAAWSPESRIGRTWRRCSSAMVLAASGRMRSERVKEPASEPSTLT
mmetsp:Transcript_22231/g.72053  ORF Transcript_22231/g.72053 Transcript_22231/m.72053 type:complete len:215 (+) Transcript_22231:314-958(+)